MGHIRDTLFNVLPDTSTWTLVKNHCRTTVAKRFTEKEPTDKFKKGLLIAEHSPIRGLVYDWSWQSIKYWVSTEWSRHKFEKFISSQRNDRQDKYDRNAARQDALVDFCGTANQQNLIDAWRKRLCVGCAAPEARELAEDFKVVLHETHPLEAGVLVPNCIYRWGCPEMNTSCGYFHKFITHCVQEGYSLDQLCAAPIEKRYELYNEWFYKMYEDKMNKR